MNKVYIVTEGDYSDYRIIRVFLDYKKAREFVKSYNLADRYYNAGIELHEVDTDTRVSFYVDFLSDSLTMDNVEADHFPTDADGTVETHNQYIRVYLKARSKEEAIKRAAGMAAEYKSLNNIK